MSFLFKYFSNNYKYSLFSSPNILVPVITILALFLSLLYIGSDSIWFDEANSIYFATLPWKDFFRVITTYEANQGFYFLLLKLWLNLGKSETIARTLSVIFAVCSVPFIYLTVDKLFGKKSGLVAALLLSLNTFFLYFAQETRGYSLLLLFVIIGTYLFIKLVEDPLNKNIWCGYILVGVVSVYVHFFAALVLLAHFCTIPFLPPSDNRNRRFFVAYFTMGLFILPIVYFVLMKDAGQIDWIKRPSICVLKKLFQELSGNAANRGYNKQLYFVACCGSAVYAMVSFFKSRRSIDTWRFVLMFFLAGIPVLVTFAVSFFKPIYQEKYLIVSLPGLVMLTAIGISSIKKPFLFHAVLGLFVLSSTFSIFKGYYPKVKENYRDSISYVVSAVQPGDGIIIHDQETIIPVKYYLNKYYPNGIPLDCVYPAPFGQYDYLKTYPIFTETVTNTLNKKYDRIWVFLRNIHGGEIDADTALVVSTLSRGYRQMNRRDFGNLVVWQFGK